MLNDEEVVKLPLKMMINGEWVIVGEGTMLPDGHFLVDVKDESIQRKLGIGITDVSIVHNTAYSKGE